MPSATPETGSILNDRRSLRTRSALRDALLTLLHERDWDAISVQDLCERANVGRSTFYTHFDGKDALLVGSLDDLRAGLREAARRKGNAAGEDPLAFARGLIEHAHEQRRVFRLLVGRRSGYVVQQRFKEMVVRLVGEEMPGADLPGLPRAAAQRWIAGAFVELLGWWVEQRSMPAPAHVQQMFEQLARPVWKALEGDASASASRAPAGTPNRARSAEPQGA